MKKQSCDQISNLTLMNIIEKKYYQFLDNNNIFLFKMLVTFLLQKPKILMKYFILIFSYMIKIISNNIL